jgi:hypothetical protein
MEEKMIVVWKKDVDELNKALEEGWHVKTVAPFTQSIAVTGSCYHSETAGYGAYVVLEKSLI